MAELQGRTGCIFTESAPLPGLASERLQSQSAHPDPPNGLLLVLAQTGLLLYQSESPAFGWREPFPQSINIPEQSDKVKFLGCKTKDQALDPR